MISIMSAVLNESNFTLHIQRGNTEIVCPAHAKAQKKIAEDAFRKVCKVFRFDSLNEQQTCTPTARFESCGARMNKGGINLNIELEKQKNVSETNL